MDIVALDGETLSPLYGTSQSWIADEHRNHIDLMLNGG
jgi:hypothetical protein